MLLKEETQNKQRKKPDKKHKKKYKIYRRKKITTHQNIMSNTKSIKIKKNYKIRKK